MWAEIFRKTIDYIVHIITSSRMTSKENKKQVGLRQSHAITAIMVILSKLAIKAPHIMVLNKGGIGVYAKNRENANHY